MKFVRTILALGFLFLCAPQAAEADDWSPWYTVEDGYKNLIRVRFQRSSIKGSGGICDIQYQFRNDYAERASFSYKVYVDGGQVGADSQLELGKGDASISAANVHSTKDIWVKVTELHAGGSHTLMPAVR